MPVARRSLTHGERERIRVATATRVREEMEAQGLNGLPEITCLRLAFLLGPLYERILLERPDRGYRDGRARTGETRVRARPGPSC